MNAVMSAPWPAALCAPAQNAIPPDSEREVIAACLRGENRAWETLVRKYSRLIYGLCYRFTGSHSQAEDLTQEVFLRVYRTLAMFRLAEASFATWLSRVTRNLLIDHYRQTGQDRLTQSTEDHPRVGDVTAATSEHPERVLAAREASDVVQTMLMRLDPDLREAIVYRDLQDMDYREIADVIGIPVGTVKSRLNRARAQLARLARPKPLHFSLSQAT